MQQLGTNKVRTIWKEEIYSSLTKLNINLLNFIPLFLADLYFLFTSIDSFVFLKNKKTLLSMYFINLKKISHDYKFPPSITTFKFARTYAAPCILIRFWLCWKMFSIFLIIKAYLEYFEPRINKVVLTEII